MESRQKPGFLFGFDGLIAIFAARKQ